MVNNKEDKGKAGTTDSNGSVAKYWKDKTDQVALDTVNEIVEASMSKVSEVPASTTEKKLEALPGEYLITLTISSPYPLEEINCVLVGRGRNTRRAICLYPRLGLIL